MVNLAVKIGKLRLKNPVMVASGTFGEEYKDLVNMNSLGAYVTKTITLKARSGNPPPRVTETASGMLNSIGLENKGLDDFIKNKMPFLSWLKVPIIASISGDDEDEFSELAKGLSKLNKIAALEINLSCPNLIRRSSVVPPSPRLRRTGVRRSYETGIIAQDEEATYKVIRAVRKATKLTVIAKLSPNVTDITRIAKASEDAGADAILLINTFLAMAIDVDTKKPILGNITGGLSGPAIKPIALRMVWETYNKVKIPIIGCGGIMDYKDAIEFILCGARAIQIGTANFINPKAPVEIIGGIKKYLVKNKLEDINKLVGRLSV